MILLNVYKNLSLNRIAYENHLNIHIVI